MPLRTGPGWREVPPRPTGLRIAWESAGRIRIAETDFRAPLDGGPAGPVDSPLVYDADDGFLYHYGCPDWSGTRGRNGITRIDPTTGRSELHFPLHPLRWVPWMLFKIPGKPLLMGLVVTDASRPERPGIVLQHQLGLFHTGEKKSLYRPLPAGCQHPVAVAPGSDRLLFHGTDGYQIVNLKGHRRLLLSDPVWGDGRSGGAFHPGAGDFVIGGAEMALYRPSERRRTLLTRGGAFPAWTDGGRGLLFCGSSSDLAELTPETGERRAIVSIPGNRHPELKRARPPALSPDERYFALPLTHRSPFHSEVVRPEQPLWSERQTLVIGDRKTRELWQHPGPVAQCEWAGGG